MARTSKTRFAILGMLTIEPMTGYRLREVISASVGHFWQESFGQLYPTLRELEQDGLVVADRVTGAGRPKVQYAVTDAGRSVLRAWLASETESLISNRSELLLQVFFGRHAAPGVVLGHLERHRGVLLSSREQFGVLAAVVAAEKSPDRPYWLATVRHGMAMIEAGLVWIDQTVAELATVEEVADA